MHLGMPLHASLLCECVFPAQITASFEMLLVRHLFAQLSFVEHCLLKSYNSSYCLRRIIDRDQVSLFLN